MRGNLGARELRVLQRDEIVQQDHDPKIRIGANRSQAVRAEVAVSDIEVNRAFAQVLRHDAEQVGMQAPIQRMPTQQGFGPMTRVISSACQTRQQVQQETCY